ncbi:hypothetical protein DNTS_028669, partial [Danionella cerebrum]
IGLVHDLTAIHDGGLLDTRRTRRGQDSIQSTPNRTGQDLSVDMLPENMTQVVEDSQKYYSWSSFGPGDKQIKDLWIDLESVHQSPVRVHGILSNAHRQASRVALTFDFPFYGHKMRQITIATGGFIFMGEMMHRMLTATQYIAPLMANFDPSYSKKSTVKYLDNGELFVVQWDNVRLKDREKEGSFTFQTILCHNGTIVFGYKNIPLPVEKMNSTEHPVKVGLSDAFIGFLPSTQASETKQRTIYEYHRVEVDTTQITNSSAFVFTPLPTCIQHITCTQCLQSNITSGCSWCSALQRCSDGIDRHRQEWLDFRCHEKAKGSCDGDNAQGSLKSSNSPFRSPPPSTSPSPVARPASPMTEGAEEVTEHSAIVAGVVAALVLLVFLTLLAVYYVNTHPTIAPPFYLMQHHTNNYWPSIKFRNQGCHSSYAEVDLGGYEKEGFIEAEQC